MNTKLTLSLDQAIISQAKKHLQSSHKSLSQLVEDYFKVLIDTKLKPGQGTPIVKGLTGIAKTSGKQDEKDAIVDYLQEKYR